MFVCVCVCVCVCERQTPKDKKWAAYEVVMVDAEEQSVPVGTGCEVCYEIGVDQMKFKTFRAFSDEHEKSEELRLQVAQARANLEKDTAPTEFATWGVAHAVRMQVEVEEEYRGYSDVTMRRCLDVARLTQAATHSIPQITLPSMSRPSDSTTYYLFKTESSYADDDEGKTIKVRMLYDVAKETKFLRPAANKFEKHGAMRYDHEMKVAMEANNFKALVCPKLTDFKGYVAAFKGSSKARKPETAWTPKAGKTLTKLAGRAAGELVVLDAEEAVADQNEDLTARLDAQEETPTKNGAATSSAQSVKGSPTDGADTVVTDDADEMTDTECEPGRAYN